MGRKYGSEKVALAPRAVCIPAGLRSIIKLRSVINSVARLLRLGVPSCELPHRN